MSNPLYDFERSIAAAQQNKSVLQASNAFNSAGGYNNGFFLTDPGEDENENQYRRLEGLSDYVISDLDPRAAQRAADRFGRLNPNITGSNNYGYIGRALCSAHGYTGSPTAFLLQRGAELDLHAPDTFQNDNDLYISIGEQYCTQKRGQAQKRLADEQAALDARAIAPLRASVAAEAWVRGEQTTFTPEEAEALRIQGIDMASMALARRAYNIYRHGIYDLRLGSHENRDRFLNLIDQLDAIPDLPEKDITKDERARAAAKAVGIRPSDITYYLSRYERSRNNPDYTNNIFTLESLADMFGDNEQAEQLFINLISNDAVKREQEMRGKGKTGTRYAQALTNVGSELFDFAYDKATLIPAAAQNIVGDLAEGNYGDIFRTSYRQRKRDEFVAKVRNTNKAASEDYKTNLPMPFFTDVPATAVEEVGSMLPYFSRRGLVNSIPHIFRSQQRQAAARIDAGGGNAALKVASWYETVAIPAEKAAITAGAFKAAGMFNAYVGSRISGMFLENTTSRTVAITNRILNTPVLGRAAGAAGAVAIADLTMQEIGVLEAIGNTAVDKLNQKAGDIYRQSTYKEQWEGLREQWRPENLKQRAFTALVFGMVTEPGLHNLAEIRKWQDNMGMDSSQRRFINSARTAEERKERVINTYNELALKDPEKFAENCRKTGEAILKEEELQQLAKAGITDYVLQQAGMQGERLPDGRTRYTIRSTDKEGKPTETEVTWTDAQRDAYIAWQLESLTRNRLLETQARVRGEKLLKAAESKGSDSFRDIISLADFAPELVKTMPNGKLTRATIEKLAELAERNIRERTEQYKRAGKSEAAARAAAEQSEFNNGVSNATVARLAADYSKREQYARETGELSATDTAESHALLLPGMKDGNLVMLIARGEITESQALHELIERAIRRQLANGTTLQRMKESLSAIVRDIKEKIPGAAEELFNGLDTENNLSVVETLSRLAQARFLVDHEAMPLSAETHAALNTAADHLADVQNLFTLGELWHRYAATEEGKAALAENGQLLNDIIEKAFGEIQDYYSAAEKIGNAEALQTVQEADRAAAENWQQLGERLKTEEQTAADFTPEKAAVPTGEPETIPAAESLTGEEIPAAEIRERNCDPATGEIVPPPTAGPRQTNGKTGRGLHNNTYYESADGSSIYGAAPAADIRIPKGIKTDPYALQLMRQNSSEETPILCYRSKNGLTALNGYEKLIRAREEGDTFVQVEILKQKPTKTDIENEVLAYKIQHGQATAADIVRHQQLNPGLTRTAAVERALITRDIHGQETAESRLAWELAKPEHSQLRKDVQSGKTSTRAALKKLTQESIGTTAELHAAERSHTPLSEMLEQRHMKALINYARRNARGSHMFSTARDRDLQTAFGKVSGLISAINAYLPPESRLQGINRAQDRLKAYTELAGNKEAQQRAAQTLGQETVDQYNTIQGKAERRAFITQALEREHTELLQNAAHALETHLVNKTIERVESLLDRYQPQQQPSGKYKKGTLGAEGHREAEHIRQLINLTPETAAAQRQELYDRLAALRGRADKSVQETIGGKKQTVAEHIAATEYTLGLLTAFGALRYKTIGQVESASNHIYTLLQTRRSAWELITEQRNARIKEAQEALKRIVPQADSANVQYQEQRESKIANYINSFMTIPQLLDLIAEKTGMDYFKQKRNDINTAVIAYRNARNADYAAEDTWHAERGRRNQIARAKWLEEAKTTRATGIDTEGEAVSPDKRDPLTANKNMRLSKMQAAQIILLAEQPAYAELMDHLGYTAPVLKRIKDYAGTEVMDYAYWARDYLNTLPTAEIYEARMGVPFPAEENYFPAAFETSNAKEDTNSLLETARNGLAIYNFLIPRVEHTLNPTLTRGVDEIFHAALDSHRNYLHIAEHTESLRQFLWEKHTRTRMKELLGTNDFKNFEESIAVLDAASIMESNAMRAQKQIMTRIMDYSARALLAGSGTTAAKQITAVLNPLGYSETSKARFLAELPFALLQLRHGGKNAPMSVRGILDLPAFKARYRADNLYEKLSHQPADSKYSSLSLIVNQAMHWTLEKTDVWANAIGHTALYNISYRRLKKENPLASETALRAQCEQIVTNSLAGTAQPIENVNRSIRRVTSPDPDALETFFLRSDMLQKLGMALASVKRSNGGALSKIGAFLATLAPISLMEQSLTTGFSMLFGNAPDSDSDEFGGYLMRNFLMGTSCITILQHSPMISPLIREANAWGSGGQYIADNATGGVAITTKDLKQSATAYKAIAKRMTGEQDWDDWSQSDIEAIGNATRLLYIGGGYFSRTSKWGTRAADLVGAMATLFNAEKLPGRILRAQPRE